MSVVTVALGTLLRLALDPLLVDHHPFTIYFAAVAISAWYGGFAPALMATILAYLAADWFFVPPRYQFHQPHQSDLDEFVGLIAFVISSLAIAYTSKIMREALQRARQKQRDLEREIIERERAEKDLQQAQTQLRRHAAVLEERVEERTAHLQETIHSLEGVCYHIAHDLRAPLRAMEGYNKILLNQYGPRFDAAGEEYANRVSEAAGRMDLLIHGLLEYGRLGHEQFPIEPIDSGKVLHRVLAMLKPEIARKQAEVNIKGEFPLVRGNEKLLEIVLQSLLSNALKFVAPGIPPKIKLLAKPRGEPPSAPHMHWDHEPSPCQKRAIASPSPWGEGRGEGEGTVRQPTAFQPANLQPTVHEGMIRFTVADNGIGIAPEYLHKVFRIFERLHSNDYYAGTGIGLALATKAAERMDGRLGVESALHQGSQFWIELTAVPAAHSERIMDSANADLVELT